eukprot:scaffold24197_cov51-Attheya_sp.AAC.1
MKFTTFYTTALLTASFHADSVLAQKKTIPDPDGKLIIELMSSQNQNQQTSASQTLVDPNRLCYMLVDPECDALAIDSPQQLAVDWIINTQDQTELAQLLTENSVQVLEVLSLAVLYFSTSGGAWEDQCNFLSGLDPCTWNVEVPILGFSFSGERGTPNILGTTCHDGRLSEIRLISLNLVGSIPEEIGLLTDLNILELSDNNLTGDIPRQIRLLVNLFILNLREFMFLVSGHDGALLDSNKLSGAIPTELGSLVNLSHLSLGEFMVLSFRYALLPPNKAPAHFLSFYLLSICKFHSLQQACWDYS